MEEFGDDSQPIYPGTVVIPASGRNPGVGISNDEEEPPALTVLI
jgi:hypothetical protein